MTVRVLVDFAEHVPQRERGSMHATLAAYGSVAQGAAESEWTIEVYRISKLSGLKTLLAGWERHGFVKWSCLPEPSG